MGFPSFMSTSTRSVFIEHHPAEAVVRTGAVDATSEPNFSFKPPGREKQNQNPKYSTIIFGTKSADGR